MLNCRPSKAGESSCQAFAAPVEGGGKGFLGLGGGGSRGEVSQASFCSN